MRKNRAIAFMAALLMMVQMFKPCVISAADEEITKATASEAELFVEEEVKPEKYPRDENGKFLVVQNYVDKIDLVPDAMLFGQWDSTGNVIAESLLDYEEYPNMAAVKAAAQNGDYAAAKIELLEYYRGVVAKRPASEEPKYSEMKQALADALETNFLRNAYSQIKYLGKVTVTEQHKEITLDIPKTNLDMLLEIPVIKLVAVEKSGTRARISARERVDEAPKLVVMVNGEQRIFTAMADSTVRAGEAGYKVFQEDYLYVQESPTAVMRVEEDDLVIEDFHEPPPVDQNTERALMKFDLSGLSAEDNIQSAYLSIHASLADGEGSKTLLVFRPGDNTWDESNVCWNAYEHAMACYDNEPYIRFHSLWKSGFSRRYRDELQRLYGFVDYAAEMYMYSSDADEKERYAEIALRQYCGFFDQLGNVPIMAWENMEDSYLSSKHGRNALDVGVRPQNLFQNMCNLINSKWMTEEIWTSLVKYAYRTAELLADPQNWHYDKNWGVLETGGFFTTNLYFKELRKVPEWNELVYDRLFSDTQLNDDYASVEVPLSYVCTALDGILTPQLQADIVGEVVEYPERAKWVVQALQKYVIYSSQPGFYGLKQGNGSASSVIGKLKTVRKIVDDPLFEWVDSGGTKGCSPAFTSHRYLSNKHYIMRTGWSKSEFFMQTNIDGGYHNHGHEDDLSIILSAYGKNLITDCGYDGLDYGNPSTIWLNSTRAHNTVEVNEKTQIDDHTRGIENEWETNGAYDYFNGTTEQNTDARHTRHILFIRDGVWIVTDYLQPNNTSQNHYVQLWHLMPDANLTLDESTGETRSHYSDSNIHIIPSDVAEYDKSEIHQGYYGGGTGSLFSANYVGYEKDRTGNATFATVIVPDSLENPLTVSSEKLPLEQIKDEGAQALALNIKGNDGVREGSYYTVNDFEQIQSRAFGHYRTNGSMAYVETMDGSLSKVYYRNATKKEQVVELKDSNTGKDLIVSGKPIGSLAVEYDAGIVRVYTEDEIEHTKNLRSRTALDTDGLKIYAPNRVNRLYINDVLTDFTIKDGYIVFDESGEAPSVDHSKGNGEGTGHGGSSGNSLGSDGIAAPVNPTEPVTPPAEDPKVILKEELLGHWAETEISTLIDDGVVVGSERGLQLEDSITRAEFAAMLVRGLNILTDDEVHEFADVSQSSWYYKTINTAYHAGIISGYENHLRPEESITREEMAKMIINAVEYAGKLKSHALELTVFSDSNKISDWARQSVADAVLYDLITGFPDGSFRPHQESLREQAMVMIYRLRAMK